MTIMNTLYVHKFTNVTDNNNNNDDDDIVSYVYLFIHINFSAFWFRVDS